MVQPLLLWVCDSPDGTDTVCPTVKGCCFTHIISEFLPSFFPFFLLSFPSFQGTVLQRFDPTPEELCCCFQRVKEEAAWASSTIAEARISSWMWYPTATWHMQFLPQSQANPEFITISWALNKLTPSLCQDSVRAEQFAFRASMDVSSPLQFSGWQKSNQDTTDCT